MFNSENLSIRVGETTKQGTRFNIKIGDILHMLIVRDPKTVRRIGHLGGSAADAKWEQAENLAVYYSAS
jgi:hypothetical protein